MMTLLSRLLRRAALLWLVATAGPLLADAVTPAGELSLVAAAQADDDDGDGDDGSDGDDDRSDDRSDDRDDDDDDDDRRYAPRQRDAVRQAPRRVQRQAAPAAAWRERQIVAFGLSAPELDTVLAQGFRIRSREPLGALGGEIVNLSPPAGTNLASARDSLRRIAPGASVDFNHFYDPSAAEACGGSLCVAPALVGWPIAHDPASACRTPDVTVGLIDTAINASHETFAASRIEVHQLHPAAKDRSGQQHGTAVASLLVGTGPAGTPGLLPGARLIAVDAFGANDRADVYDLVRSIDILAARDVQIINMSLSGPDNAVLRQAIELVASRQIDMVAAAGNDGPGGEPAYPAAYADVIAVTAVDRGKRVYRRANQGDYIDLAAPGVGVWAAASIKGSRPKTGTSFAAPFVTAALVLARADGSAAADPVKLLTDGAEDLGQPGKDPVYGWGLLDASSLCAAR